MSRNNRPPRKATSKLRFIIRKGPWYCVRGHWVRAEPAPLDVLVPIGQELCSNCKRKHAHSKTR